MRKRIVTGNDSNGKSYFVTQGETPGQVKTDVFSSEEIWIDDPAKPDPEMKVDPVDLQQHHLCPPTGGSRIRVFTFPPQSEVPEFTPEIMMSVAAQFDTGGVMEADNPGMHTTTTIDYGIILQGEIDLELDAGEVHLQTGDIVVQRATRHAWRNRGTEPCAVAFILISSPNYG
jgi:mannose-6-phosphate isomerase-like protein (cupin superfamily)